ncbi:hypothetical protein BH11PSE9_BH11PSE9_17180 [soil metagenome]
MTLKAARAARDEARKTLASGTNPMQQRRADKFDRATNSATTFEAVAREFHATKTPGWSESHARQWLRCMTKDVFPWVGSMPVSEVSAPLLLHTLQRVEQRGALQMAHDLREWAGQVFKHGIATGRCERNPAAALSGTLQARIVKNAAAVLSPNAAGELLRGIGGYSGQPATRAALMLSALLFQRPGNIRQMERAEIDEAGALWTIPSEKMKRTVHAKVNGPPHLVPLAKQTTPSGPPFDA